MAWPSAKPFIIRSQLGMKRKHNGTLSLEFKLCVCVCVRREVVYDLMELFWCTHPHPHTHTHTARIPLCPDDSHEPCILCVGSAELHGGNVQGVVLR